MSTLLWIVAAGLAMAAFTLVGGLAFLLSDATFKRLVMPLVAMAAGSLLGGALFVMLPEATEQGHGSLAPWVWVAAGFVCFLVLEQFLHWHHCHRSTHDHEDCAGHGHGHAAHAEEGGARPFTVLMFIAACVHHVLCGLAMGSAFLVDVRFGIITWLVEAVHEVPQELGDFGIFVHGGWSRRKALLLNFTSGLFFLVGGVVAWSVARTLDVQFLIPFAAGNFIYIAASDLIPEINRHGGGDLRRSVTHFLAFLGGLGLILLLTRLVGEHHHHDGHHGEEVEAGEAG